MTKKEINQKMSNVGQIWPDVLGAYLSDYSVKLSASDVSRKTHLERRSVSRVLNKLVEFNLISYAREGKNKMFYLDLRKQITKIIINIAENQKSLNFQLRTKKIAVIINEFLNYCDGIIIFGSYSSRISHADSDLDIIIFGANKGKIKQIKEKYLMEINEHYAGYKEFEKMLKKRKPLAIEILNNHILFGDVSRLIKIFWRTR